MLYLFVVTQFRTENRYPLFLETLTMRIVQTGRDCARRTTTGHRTACGRRHRLDGTPIRLAAAVAPAGDTLDSDIEGSRAFGAALLRGGFTTLPGSRREIEEIVALYRGVRPADPVEVWQKNEASEARLTAYAPAPRTRPPTALAGVPNAPPTGRCCSPASPFPRQPGAEG